MTTFPLADVLSITTGHLVSRRQPPVDGVCDLVRYLTGQRTIYGDHFHGPRLLAAANEARAELLRQHPHLADVAPPEGIDRVDLYGWLITEEAAYGETLPVSRPPIAANAIAGFGGSLAAVNDAMARLIAVMNAPTLEES